MTEQLKPCPFCGDKRPVIIERLHYLIRCARCASETKDYHTLEAVIEAWNNRTQPNIGLCKESIHWHKYHHPKCGDCKYSYVDKEYSKKHPDGFLCRKHEYWFHKQDFYCAKWEKKDD